MLKLKSQLTCSYCSKILKDPIELPCDDSICRAHLSERDVVKENRIKCNGCKQVYQVKENHFKSSNALKNLIESQSYLSEDESSLKQKLEASIRDFFQLNDKFNLNKTQVESHVFEHFQAMRFEIELQREKLKKLIDDIALEMIDETEKYEAMYLNNLKRDLFKSPHFDETKTLENKLNEIEETFRNPNLLIQSIQDMQQRQEASLNDIRLKLNQMTKIKANLKETNEFKPNVSLFDQKEDTSLFGSIKLNGYSNTNSFKSSQILKDERQMSELMKLCEFSPSDKWSLLYRGTRDGFGAKDFHTKCDGHPNTLTILKAKQSSFIFGGFTSVSWESSTDGKWKSDQNAFIFSLINKGNKSLKIKIDPKRHQSAIACYSLIGPSFGIDMVIAK